MEIVITFLYVYKNAFVLLLVSNVQFPCNITHPHRHKKLHYALIINVNYKECIKCLINAQSSLTLCMRIISIKIRSDRITKNKTRGNTSFSPDVP